MSVFLPVHELFANIKQLDEQIKPLHSHRQAYEARHLDKFPRMPKTSDAVVGMN